MFWCHIHMFNHHFACSLVKTSILISLLFLIQGTSPYPTLGKGSSSTQKWRLVPGNSFVTLFGMFKGAPFKWLLVTSNDRGWKGHELNHLGYRDMWSILIDLQPNQVRKMEGVRVTLFLVCLWVGKLPYISSFLKQLTKSWGFLHFRLTLW